MADDSSSWSAVDSLLGDRYTREARLAPAFLCVFPILILLMAWFKGLQDAVPALLSLLCVFGVVRWISHIARGIGDQIEIELFREWGGKPTTTMLRVALNCVKTQELELFKERAGGKTKSGRQARSDEKVRHLLGESPHADELKKLIKERKGPGFPEKEEDTKIEESHRSKREKADMLDSLYEPVVAWMRENLRDSKMVAEEEISYGFQRNFFALRKFALWSNGVAFLVQVGVIVSYHGRHHAWAMTPSVAAVILVANLLYLAGVLKFVKEDDVKVQGFIYARQLFDSLYASDGAGKKGKDGDDAADGGNGGGKKPK